ncbi:FAR-17a/AIG1-like protein [Vairimorpha necatrix]|uniref:FAR-17a/AIG1-like protein n=1 Tax=Vairimorpha necatrix TaxID=6039 RepID=A0AAX4JFK2_9MICR
MKINYEDSSHMKALKIFLLVSCLYGTTDFCIPPEITRHYQSLYGSKYIFLTNICLYLTVICLLTGIIVRNYKYKELTKFYKHNVSVLLPLNALVTILFWVLYLIDPTLIRDKSFFEQGIKISLFTDICVHLFPFISLFLESKKLILKRSNIHLTFYIVFTFSYYLLCFYYKNLNQEWVYPILGKISTFYRLTLFGFSALLAMGIYELSMYTLSK